VLADKPRLRAALSWILPGLVFLAIIGLCFWPLWTGISGARKAFAWDAQWEYWGDLQFLHDTLRHGEFPLWNPFDRAGYPFHADPQAGILYPVNWLLVGLSFLTGPGQWLVSLKILLHFWIGAFGLYAFLRRRGLPEAAAYAGGLFFVLTYPNTHATFSALVWGIAWCPWMLLAVDAWAEAPSPARAAGVALAFGMAQLTGAPAAFWYGLLVVVPYGTWAIVHHARRSEDVRAYLRVASWTTALAAGLFVAMVAAQFLATTELVQHTVRDVRDAEFIGGSVFGAKELLAFAVPRLPAPNENPYLTIVMLFAAAAVLSAEPTPRRLVLAGVVVAGLLFAFGNHVGLLTPLASLIPPFGFFRRAHRYFFVCIVPFAILGAEGLALLARTEAAELKRRYGRFLLAAGGLGVAVFASGFIVASFKGKPLEGWRDAYGFAAASFLVSTWVLFMLVASDARGKRVFLALAVVVMGVGLWHAREPAIMRDWAAVPTTPRDADVARLTGVPNEARVYDRELFRFRPGIRLGIRDLGGYEADPLALSRYMLVLKMGQAQPKLLGHAGVRWLLEEKSTQTKPQVLSKDGLAERGPGMYELPEVAPSVQWLDAAKVVNGPEAALWALRQAHPGTLALVEHPLADPAAMSGDAPPVAGRITRYGRSMLSAEVDAPDTGIVVIAEAYYPGWRARVDGKEVPIVPVNVLFRGVVVGPGHHLIDMEYPATAYCALAPVSVAGVLAAFVLLLWKRRRSSKEAVS
jgi:hypothetical protein